MSDQSLGAIASVQGTLLAFSGLQAACDVLAWLGPNGTTGEKTASRVRRGGIFWPKLAATFTFACVVVEPRIKVAAAAIAWEAATKR